MSRQHLSVGFMTNNAPKVPQFRTLASGFDRESEKSPFVLVRMGKIQDLTDEDLAGFDFSTE